MGNVLMSVGRGKLVVTDTGLRIESEVYNSDFGGKRTDIPFVDIESVKFEPGFFKAVLTVVAAGKTHVVRNLLHDEADKAVTLIAQRASLESTQTSVRNPFGGQAIGGQVGNKAALDYIGDSIAQGEQVIATLLGVGEKTSVGALFGEKAGAALGGSYLLVTDRKVVVMKSGVGTIATDAFGLKTKTYVYDRIASVDVNRGLIFGEIEIVSAGMVEKSTGGFLAGSTRDSVVQFPKDYFSEVQRLATTIMELAQRPRQPGPLVVMDAVTQLQKLAELKDRGILTEEEFKTKKKSLLDRI